MKSEIMELSLPFRTLFEDSVNMTKEEIIKRNVKQRFKFSVPQGGIKEISQEQAKLFKGYNLNPTQVTLSQFTESDKQTVMWKFLGNPEVMFLIYGLMFPSQNFGQPQSEEADELPEIGGGINVNTETAGNHSQEY